MPDKDIFRVRKVQKKNLTAVVTKMISDEPTKSRFAAQMAQMRFQAQMKLIVA